MDSLPCELLVCIVGWLPLRDVALGVATACRALGDVAQEQVERTARDALRSEYAPALALDVVEAAAMCDACGLPALRPYTELLRRASAPPVDLRNEHLLPPSTLHREALAGGSIETTAYYSPQNVPCPLRFLTPVCVRWGTHPDEGSLRFLGVPLRTSVALCRDLPGGHANLQMPLVRWKLHLAGPLPPGCRAGACKLALYVLGTVGACSTSEGGARVPADEPDRVWAHIAAHGLSASWFRIGHSGPVSCATHPPPQ